MRMVLIAIAGLMGIATLPVVAHPDPILRIEQLTVRIKASPGEPLLYITRAGLLHRAGRLKPASADYAHALALDPNATSAWFGLAHVEYDCQRWNACIVAADRYLARQDAHSPGEMMVIRARALGHLGAHARSAAAFHQALTTIPNPTVQQYLDAACCIARAEGSDAGLSILERAQSVRGRIVVFDLLAIEIETDAHRYQAVLNRLDHWIHTAKRPERWYLRRGLILIAAGRHDDAREAFHAGLNAINALPQRTRTTVATLEVEAALQNGLDTLPDPAPIPAAAAHENYHD